MRIASRSTFHSLIFCLFCVLLPFQSHAEKLGDWLEVVRHAPYSVAKDLYRNLLDIRRWVLLEESFCSKQDRHILFNLRGVFLGYFDNAADRTATQTLLNRKRERLYNNQKVRFWVEGDRSHRGYPFALACNQPHVDLPASVRRLMGAAEADRVWGTWDGIRAGSRTNKVSLFELVLEVYKVRHEQYKFRFSPFIVGDLMGQVLIESGARKRSFSSAQAKGLLQLRPEVLKDCRVPEPYHLHRIAQVDCALKLYMQNHRNLEPAFVRVFGHLPAAKKEKLYAMLLVQAYHGGLGRVRGLLEEENLTGAADFFAREHSRFSAEEIALGLVFHNMGRRELGLASLYYLVDVEIALTEICKSSKAKNQDFCAS